MSLRAAAFVLGRRSNLRIVEGDCFGQEQVRPRNDIVRWRVRKTIFLRTKNILKVNDDKQKSRLMKVGFFATYPKFYSLLSALPTAGTGKAMV